MNKLFLQILIFFFLIFNILLKPTNAEFVFLKNGAIVECSIINDAKDSITIRRKKDRKQKVIIRKNILRIVYTNFYMGKIYVQKTDGKGIEVYMVDEDQNSYTFRKELFKPKEFVLKRSQVLFMARKNPTGLQGKAGLTQIDIKWNPPYSPVLNYNIYIKAEKSKKKKVYKLIGTTSRRAYTIEDLKSNSSYYVIVKAVDHGNYESLPTNELKLRTGNLPPTSPTKLWCRVIRDRGKKVDARLSWKPSKDADGKVVGYYLQMREENANSKKNFLDFTLKQGRGFKLNSPSYIIKKLKDKTKYFIKIAAVDEIGKKSEYEEITFDTTNQPPEEPGDVEGTKKMYSKGKKFSLQLKWDKAIDPDGTIKKYRVYKKTGDKYKKITETRNTRYTIKGLNSGTIHYFVVRAIDNRRAESAYSSVVSTRDTIPGDLLVFAIPWIPLGTFGSMVAPGFGTILSFSLDKMILPPVSLSLDIGFLYFSGKHQKISKFIMIPVLLSAKYKFPVYKFIDLAPGLSLGLSIDTIWHERFNLEQDKFEYLPERSVQPMAIMGGYAIFYFRPFVICKIGLEFGTVLEGGGLLTFASINAGVGIPLQL